MKKTNYFKLLALAIIGCISMSISAQTVTVGDSIRFMTVLDSMKLNGGGSIQLSASVKIPIIKNQTYGLESTAANPIQINTNQYSIIANGTGTSADSCILRVGNYMTITGTGTVLSGIKRGHIRVVGGSVTSNTTTSGTSTIYNGDGWIYIWGGAVSVNATGLTAGSSAAAVTAANYMSLSIMGGTISATGDYTRAVIGSDLGNGVIKPLSNATINASGSNAYGIQTIGAGSDTPMIIGNNLTFNTTSTDATDAGIVNSGTTSIIIIPSTVTGLTFNSTTNYKVDNTSAALIDLRGVTLTANPVSGALVNPTDIVFTAAGNPSMAFASTKIYYNYSAVAPTSASSTIANGGTINVSAASNTITAIVGYPFSAYNATTYTFNYTVQNAVGPIPITSFTGLKNAFLASANATDTVRLKLMSNITDSIAYSITPDAAHPIVLDANGFQINIGYGAASNQTVTFGGSLRIFSTIAPTNGIFRQYGPTVLNITGGTYTMYAGKPIIDVESGSNIDNNLSKVNLSNSTFNAYGTSNTANVVKFATSNGNLISVTGCTFNVSAKGIAVNCIGPLNITFANSTINMLGNDASSIAVSYAPTNAAPNTLTMSGLTVNMTAGKVMNLGGTKALNVVVKDLTVSSVTPTLYTYTAGTGGTLKFYDFRAFTPTVSVAPGNYSSTQSVALTLPTTGIAPVDAGVATFVYTLDGTDPIASSLTASPVNLSVATTIKMAAKSADGLFLGKIYSFPYTFTITDVANLSGDNSVSIYPTVVENSVTVSKMAKHIQVVDLAGKLMLEKSNTIQFDMSNIKSGVYLVKVIAIDDSAKTIKVVKL